MKRESLIERERRLLSVVSSTGESGRSYSTRRNEGREKKTAREKELATTFYHHHHHQALVYHVEVYVQADIQID